MGAPGQFQDVDEIVFMGFVPRSGSDERFLMDSLCLRPLARAVAHFLRRRADCRRPFQVGGVRAPRRGRWLLPKHLPSPPILPPEIMGPTGPYDCGDLVNPGGGRTEPDRRKVRRSAHTPVQGVELRQRMVIRTRLARPTLQRTDWATVRSVIETSADWDVESLPSLARFRWLVFDHPFFCRHGAFLLRWLGVPATRRGYGSLIAFTYPEMNVLRMLESRPISQASVSCQDAIDAVLAELHAESKTRGDVHGATAQRTVRHRPASRGRRSFPSDTRWLRDPTH